MYFTHKTVAFIGFLLVFLFLLASKPSASTVLFQDNFDDGDATDWTVVRNTCTTNWQVSNMSYGIIINSPCQTESIPDSLTIPPNVVYSFEVDMSMPSTLNVDRNFVFKYLNSSNWYGIHTFGNNLYLHKVVNGSENFLTNWHTSYPFVSGSTYHFKVIVKATGFDIYVNNSIHASVPESGVTFSSNKAGLQASSGGIPNSEVWFDNVLITQLDTTTPTPTPTPTPTATPTPTPITTPIHIPLPNLNVPDIKQFTLPWGNNIYDSALLWSANPFVSRWGCALTSATMVLRYYGHDIWPDELNNWLKTQTDGYIRNGLLNWLAVSRYTRINDSDTSPTLEYRRIPPTLENLSEQIEHGRPGILTEPGHFVVGKSLTTTSFGINDPAYTNRTSLDSYSNSFSTLGVFTPTHTDLSYIYLVVDADLDLKVFDSSNNEIEGFSQIENPILDSENPLFDSGDSIKSFMFPTPPEGIYEIAISGEGIYTLDSYIYDEQGNVEQNSFDGILTAESNEEFNLSIADTSEVNYPTTIDSVIRDLDETYSLGLIRKRTAYIGLRSLLIKSRRYITGKRIGPAKTSLSLTRMTIGLYTPLFINSDASQILREKLEILISSL